MRHQTVHSLQRLCRSNAAVCIGFCPKPSTSLLIGAIARRDCKIVTGKTVDGTRVFFLYVLPPPNQPLFFLTDGIERSRKTFVCQTVEWCLRQIIMPDFRASNARKTCKENAVLCVCENRTFTVHVNNGIDVVEYFITVYFVLQIFARVMREKIQSDIITSCSRYGTRFFPVKFRLLSHEIRFGREKNAPDVDTSYCNSPTTTGSCPVSTT